MTLVPTLQSRERTLKSGDPPQLTRDVKPKFASRFLHVPSCKLFPFSHAEATHGSGTGPLCPTQIRGTDVSGEHLSVPAYARTACSGPGRGLGGGETRHWYLGEDSMTHQRSPGTGGHHREINVSSSLGSTCSSRKTCCYRHHIKRFWGKLWGYKKERKQTHQALATERQSFYIYNPT